MSACKTCGAPIVFGKTPDGWKPFVAEPSPNGTHVLSRCAGGPVAREVLLTDPLARAAVAVGDPRHDRHRCPPTARPPRSRRRQSEAERG